MTTSPTSQPLLGLCIRRTSIPTRSLSDEELTVDHVRAMMLQDNEIYTCNDYLSRRKAQQKLTTTQAMDCSSTLDDPPNLVDDNSSADDSCSADTLDAVCREKMCEWSYRVCDHFHCPREVVAISFSILDRFVDRCNCDRTAFKLAAMTTLYMASKLATSFTTPAGPTKHGHYHNHHHHHHHQPRSISLQSLVELSRGEFHLSHLVEMELIVLQTLGWRVNPPTVQCFVSLLISRLPLVLEPAIKVVYHRAIFFAELALYDYSFVPRERSLIAIAALLNAMEGLHETTLSVQQQQEAFLTALEESFGLTFPVSQVESVRNRLWYVYSMSAQYKHDEIQVPSNKGDNIKESSDIRLQQRHLPETSEKVSPQPNQSPVCVTHPQP